MAVEKKYTVKVTDRAKFMLGNHVDFIAQISVKAAKDTRNEIMRAMRSLTYMPERFPYIDDESVIPNKYHKMCIAKWYAVIYEIKDDKVFVDYIVDCRQDYNWLLQ